MHDKQPKSQISKNPGQRQAPNRYVHEHMFNQGIHKSGKKDLVREAHFAQKASEQQREKQAVHGEEESQIVKELKKKADEHKEAELRHEANRPKREKKLAKEIEMGRKQAH